VRLLLCAAFLLLASGGAAKRHGGLNYFVGVECHTSMHLIGCDMSSPPNCDKVVAKFDKNCERIEK